jgi:hypothetical protein
MTKKIKVLVTGSYRRGHKDWPLFERTYDFEVFPMHLNGEKLNDSGLSYITFKIEKLLQETGGITHYNFKWDRVDCAS